jgi:hypothetical protein
VNPDTPYFIALFIAVTIIIGLLFRAVGFH